jgi:hypothetical protein
MSGCRVVSFCTARRTGDLDFRVLGEPFDEANELRIASLAVPRQPHASVNASAVTAFPNRMRRASL